MKPLQQYHRHNANGMNFRKDVILDIMREGSCTIQALMDACMTIGLASQATIHREIHELIDARYINSKKNWRDRRVVFVTITAKGKTYLEKL